MELKKWPETEEEYQRDVEVFKEFIKTTKIGLADGEIEDPTGKIRRDVKEAVEIYKKLIKEARDKFGKV